MKDWRTRAHAKWDRKDNEVIVSQYTRPNVATGGSPAVAKRPQPERFLCDASMSRGKSLNKGEWANSLPDDTRVAGFTQFRIELLAVRLELGCVRGMVGQIVELIRVFAQII